MLEYVFRRLCRDRLQNMFYRHRMTWSFGGVSPKHLQAALDANVYFVQSYAAAGGSLDAMDPDGRTALHHCASAGGVYMASLLLQSRAAVDAPDRHGTAWGRLGSVCLLACLFVWLPACLPECLHACMLAGLLAFLFASRLACLRACLPTCFHVCLLDCLPALLLSVISVLSILVVLVFVCVSSLSTLPSSSFPSSLSPLSLCISVSLSVCLALSRFVMVLSQILAVCALVAQALLAALLGSPRGVRFANVPRRCKIRGGGCRFMAALSPCCGPLTPLERSHRRDSG